MKKLLFILALFVSSNIYASYSLWYKMSDNGDWHKTFATYNDFGACENARKYTYTGYITRCAPD